MSELSITSLNRINQRVVEAVPLVNNGGCGFYATLIQRRLLELGQATETGLIGYDPPNGADHIFTVVKLDGIEYFHDGEETKRLDVWSRMDLGRWLFKPKRAPADETLSIVNSNRWNPTFQPIAHVHILCDIIETVLGPFDQRPHFNTIQGVKI